jgi:hypothetical protein
VAAPQHQDELVVLLHGLARSRFSMSLLDRALARAGYTTLNVGYPSTRRNPDELVTFLHSRLAGSLASFPHRGPEETDEVSVASDHLPGPPDPIAAAAATFQPASDATTHSAVHFVTHSLGGILVRAYLDRYEVPKLGRIVQLTPPNQGSELVDQLGALRLFGWIFGPTGRDLGTSADSLPRRAGTPPTEVGIIAGNRSLNPLGKRLLPAAGDGAVTLERTRLGGPGETDWIALPVDHTTIMNRRATAEQVIHFLRHGRFDHAAVHTDSGHVDRG